MDGVILQQMMSLGANSVIPSLEVRSGSMQGPMVSSRANGVSLSLGFYSEDFGTVLEGSGISDWFGLLSAGQMVYHVVSHGHVLGHPV